MSTQGRLILISFYVKQCWIIDKLTPILVNREYYWTDKVDKASKIQNFKGLTQRSIYGTSGPLQCLYILKKILLGNKV